MPAEKLVAFAEEAGVPDIDKFTADLSDSSLRTAVEQTTTTAQGLGVNSVPFFIAGDKALSGAQPLSSFTQFLDEQLTAAGAQ
jgi:predicted DsbA family dithiol-disulfide isomerase